MQLPDADDDLDLPRRKRPRAAAPLYYSETDVFRGADARAVDAALASLRQAATTVEDGPMRSRGDRAARRDSAGRRSDLRRLS